MEKKQYQKPQVKTTVLSLDYLMAASAPDSVTGSFDSDNKITSGSVDSKSSSFDWDEDEY